MIYDSALWTEDLDRVIDAFPAFSALRGTSVLITGAGGLICSAVADLLIRMNERSGADIQVFAAGRSGERMERRFGPFFGKPYFHFVPYDAAAASNTFDFHADYVIHGAGNAFPGMIVKEPVETMMSNVRGTMQLLDYCRESGVKRFLFISSSEVYGKKEGNEPYREGEYGYIDLLSPRNSYSVAKRAAETMCASYADEYGLDPVIIRPGHIYGPTASPSDNRVSSAFAYQAASGCDLVMKSAGSQLRSYCYCPDCASAVLTALLKGERVGAYNISDPDMIISIRDMAEITARAGGVSLTAEEPDQEDRRGFNPMSNSSLDGEKLLGLGWRTCFSPEEGLGRTVRILKESGIR